jgi:hypothetical protein
MNRRTLTAALVSLAITVPAALAGAAPAGPLEGRAASLRLPEPVTTTTTTTTAPAAVPATTTAPAPVAPAPAAPRHPAASTPKLVAPIPVPPAPALPDLTGATAPGKATNAPLVPGHWVQATNGAIYRDPSPYTEQPVGASDPAYEAGLTAQLCMPGKPEFC